VKTSAVLLVLTIGLVPALLTRMVAALALLAGLAGFPLTALLLAGRIGLALLAGLLVRVLLIGVIHILLLEDFVDRTPPASTSGDEESCPAIPINFR
jgi:hypothetical protein